MENNLTTPLSSATESLQPDQNFNNLLQQKKTSNNWKIATLILGILLIVSLGTAAYLYQQNANTQSSRTAPEREMLPETESNNQENDGLSAVGTKVEKLTYTSDTEKVSFEYPADWVVIPSTVSDSDETDKTSLKSPSGEVTVNWLSYVGGLGGLCDEKAELGTEGTELRTCPLITVIEKTPIIGAPELVVVSGTITHDGEIFKPWVAVQQKSVVTRRDIEIGTFLGRNNDANALFSTAGINLGGPELTETEAKAYLNKPEVKQAKEIMLSLKY